jgi:hypothetical protein
MDIRGYSGRFYLIGNFSQPLPIMAFRPCLTAPPESGGFLQSSYFIYSIFAVPDFSQW